MPQAKNIYSYIKAEEISYKTMPVAIVENYDWSMFDHIKLTTLYKNSQFKSGKDDNRPFKNITLPILRLAYRSEGFDVKDIKLFVDDPENYYKSFLVQKFHEKWARENKIDTFIDELVESYVDFGGALVKNTNSKRPENVPWQRIAFCDQTDLLSGPIAEKHFYPPDELLAMASKGWGNTKNGATASLEDTIVLAHSYVQQNLVLSGKQSRTPSKYVEVYEIHGMFPDEWLDSEENEDRESKDQEYTRQLHIVAFYQTSEGNTEGITLFKGPEKESPYKLILRDKIYGRALGLGGAEELFEPQVWTNYGQIRFKELIDAASKVIFQTADAAFGARNNIWNTENGEVLIAESPVSQIDTTPRSAMLFENSIASWDQTAKELGSATGATMGTGTNLGGHSAYNTLALLTQEGLAIHEYRQGQLAVFVDEIYRDWVMPYIAREIVSGSTFLSELSLDELQGVADNLVTIESNKIIKAKILNGEMIDPQEIEQSKQTIREQFLKSGNKRFIEILKGEFKNVPTDVRIDIKGKEKDLPHAVQALTGVFQQIIQSVNPQTGQSVLDDPRMAKIFNEILEMSGLSPIDFFDGTKPKPGASPPQQQPQLQAPQQQQQPNLETLKTPAARYF